MLSASPPGPGRRFKGVLALLLAAVFALALGACSSGPASARVESYVSTDQAPKVLILAVTGGPDDTATGKIVSQDQDAVVVSATLTSKSPDNSTGEGYPTYAPVVLDAPLNGRPVRDTDGNDVRQEPDSG